MYNVLIVDDNFITKKSIILTIDWLKLGCRVIADADDGATALTLARQYKPDVIVTDIRMPGMDGLKLTEKAKELFPWVKVIIMTGYSEFTYAQEALRIGAFDLIVKPIDNDELSKVIKKAVTTLDSESQEQSEKEHLKSAIEKNRNLILVKAVTDCIEGLNAADFFSTSMQKYIIFTINYKTDLKNIDDEDCHGFIEGSNKAAETLKRKFDFDFIYFWLNNGFSIVIMEKNGQPFQITKEGIIEICNFFINNNSAIRQDNYSIGISKIHTHSKEIKLAYTESLGALESGFYFLNQKIIFSDMIKAKGVINECMLMKKLYCSIKELNPDKFNQAIEETHEILISETPSIQSVKSLLSNVCLIALDFYYNTKGYPFYHYKSHSEISNEINAIDSLEGMISYVKNFVELIIACPNNDLKENYSKVTLQVIDYLNEHYNKKVSLQEISDYVSLTPSHLSRVIKKDTGESFVDLFNKIKIGIAEKLLKETNLKAYEVANKIGIDNYSYFYQLFKKATGISPTDYYSRQLTEYQVDRQNNNLKSTYGTVVK